MGERRTFKSNALRLRFQTENEVQAFDPIILSTNLIDSRNINPLRKAHAQEHEKWYVMHTSSS